MDDFYLNAELEDTLTNANGFQRRHVLFLGEKLIGIPNKLVFESEKGIFDVTDESLFSGSYFEEVMTNHFPTLRFVEKGVHNGKNVLFTGITTDKIGFDLSSQVSILVNNISDLQDVQLIAGGAIYKDDNTTDINLVIVLPVSIDYKIDGAVFSSASGGIKTSSGENKLEVTLNSLVKNV